MRSAGVASAAAIGAEKDRPVAARYATFAVAGSHAVMASVMAMTPVHLAHMAHGEHGTSTSDVTLLVGMTIGLHVAGMYGLSPVFGILADRWGRVRVILLGQACSSRPSSRRSSPSLRSPDDRRQRRRCEDARTRVVTPAGESSGVRDPTGGERWGALESKGYGYS